MHTRAGSAEHRKQSELTPSEAGPRDWAIAPLGGRGAGGERDRSRCSGRESGGCCIFRLLRKRLKAYVYRSYTPEKKSVEKLIAYAFLVAVASLLFKPFSRTLVVASLLLQTLLWKPCCGKPWPVITDVNPTPENRKSSASIDPLFIWRLIARRRETCP